MTPSTPQLVENVRLGRAIENDFPVVEVSQVAEHESWRKEINRPLYHIHKWWATRLGSVFRAMNLAALSPSGTNIWESFYKFNDLAGRVILDPFMGSGTTLGEAASAAALIEAGFDLATSLRRLVADRVIVGFVAPPAPA